MDNDEQLVDGRLPAIEAPQRELWTRHFYVTLDNHMGVRRLPGSCWTLYWNTTPPWVETPNSLLPSAKDLGTVDGLCCALDRAPYLLECDVNAVFISDFHTNNVWELLTKEEWKKFCIAIGKHSETLQNLKFHAALSDNPGQMLDWQMEMLLGHLPCIRRLFVYNIGACHRTMECLASLAHLKELHLKDCILAETMCSALAASLQKMPALTDITLEKIRFDKYQNWLKLYDAMKVMDGLQVIVLGTLKIADTSTRWSSSDQAVGEDHADFYERVDRAGINKTGEDDFSKIATQHLEHHTRLHRVGWHSLRCQTILSHWVNALLEVSDQFDCSLELIRANPELFATAALEALKKPRIATRTTARDSRNDRTPSGGKCYSSRLAFDGMWDWLSNNFRAGPFSSVSRHEGMAWRDVDLIYDDITTDDEENGDLDWTSEDGQSSEMDFDLLSDDDSNSSDKAGPASLEEAEFFGMPMVEGLDLDDRAD